jgi:hypothetical protein
MTPLTDNSTGVLGIHRVREAGPYTANDKRRVARFLPHLQRALCTRAPRASECGLRTITRWMVSFIKSNFSGVYTSAIGIPHPQMSPRSTAPLRTLIRYAWYLGTMLPIRCRGKLHD